MKFFLRQGDVVFQLPVNPQEYDVDSPFAHEDLDVEGLGEVTIIKERGLKLYTIESFFPFFYNPTFCEYADFEKPTKLVKMIEEWRDKKKPLQYIVTGGSWQTNVEVTVRSFRIIERGGAPNDIYYAMELKEWRAPKVSKKGEATTRPASASTSDNVLPTTHTVKTGETLQIISKTYYGTFDKWQKIHSANDKVIGDNYNQIEVGMKLVVPK